MARSQSAIGTRLMAGRASASRAVTGAATTAKLAGRSRKDSAATGVQQRQEESQDPGSESELTPIPSDLSDEEYEGRPTESAYFGGSDITIANNLKVAEVTLGKRRRVGNVRGQESLNGTIASSNVPKPTAKTQQATDSESGGLRKRLRRGLGSSHGGSDVPSSSTTTRQEADSANRTASFANANVATTTTATASSSRGTRRRALKNDNENANWDQWSVRKQEQAAKAELEAADNDKAALRVQKEKKPKKENPTPVTLAPPPHWEEMYDLVREMRSRIPAPVDTMGCERLAEEESEKITPAIQRFQTLVSLMLSSQTKDTVTAVAIRNLQTLLPGGLTVPSILATDTSVIDAHIAQVGFHNKKAQYMKKTAQILREKYADDIPRSIEELCALPGIGPKMAHLCMSAAWNDTQGIGVDVHVHRITNMWGWTGKKGTETPEQTRVALESWLPRDRWREINYLLVGFGQTVCLSRGPKCGECTLAERGLCRAARVGPRKRGLKREVKTEVGEVAIEAGEEIEEKLEDGVEIKQEEDEAELVPGVAHIKLEVKVEEDEAMEDIKREVKEETVEEGSERATKHRLHLKKEYSVNPSENIPDMEDIIANAESSRRSTRRKSPKRRL